MNAYIKKDKWERFKHAYGVQFGFYTTLDKKNYVKPLNEDVMLVVNKRTRKLDLVTPMGVSPFMEVHKQFYEDLINEGFIEYKQGKFD